MARHGTAGPEMTALLRRVGSTDPREAAVAEREMAEALTGQLRVAPLLGDVISDVFTPEQLAPGATATYLLDLIAPGTEADHMAYAIPLQGHIPNRLVEGAELTVPTYEVGSSIDYPRRYARDARWNVMARAMQILEASFVRKMNEDGFHALEMAALANAYNVYDDQAPPGYLSKRLIEILRQAMRRLGGGNTGTVNRRKLDRLYVSPEAMGDMRSWTLEEVDDVTRRQIFLAEDNTNARVFGIDVRELDELGVGQPLQTYWTTTLGGTMPTYTRATVSETKLEICIGLSLADDSFVMPVREAVQVIEDPTEARNRRVSFYGFGEHGFAVLDTRRVIVGSL
jgi:hypothetical protein